MSGLLNDLKVRLGADISQFRDAISKANSQLDSLAGFAKVAGKGLAGLAVFGAMGKLAKEITEVTLAAGAQAEELAQLKEITGQNTDALQGYDVLLNRVGLSQSDLQMGFKTLSQKLEEARRGVGDAGDRFRQLGIDITKVGSTTDLLREIAEQSSHVAAGSEKAAMMTDLLGRMGLKLIPAFNGGARAIDEAAKKSKQMTELSGVQIASLGRMDDAVDDLRMAWTRFGQQLGALFAPAVEMVANYWTWLLSVVSSVLKKVDTALDTLAIRFTHLGLAISEAASVLFSTDLFNGAAWSKAIENIKLIDQEAAKLIAKRRALADAPEAADTRPKPGQLVDSAKLLEAAKADADAMQRISEQTFKSAEAQWKATADHTIAEWEEMKSKFIVNGLDMAEAHASIQRQMREITKKALIEQISNYSAWMQSRIGMEKAGSKEREALEGQANAKLVEMWNQVVVNEIAGDAERIRSAVAVAAARQEVANQEAEAGLQRFNLYAAMTEREKQFDVDRTASALAVVQAQEGARESQFQDHRRILEATLAALAAEEAKEVSSVKITEAEKAAIRERFRARRIEAEGQYVQAVQASRTAELSDAAKVADAKFNLLKAEQDQQFALFRDTDLLRKQKVAALTAQYEADLLGAKDNAAQKLAVETNYYAQLKGVAQQFPTFWEQQLQTIQQSAVFTWSAITQSFATSLAGVIQGTATMAQFFQQALTTMLTAVIQMVIQLGAQWALATLFKGAEDAKQLGLHKAMEGTKTAVTASAEASRVALTVATNKALLASVTTTLAGYAVVGNAAMAVMQAALTAVIGFLLAVAAAVAPIPIVGQVLAGSIIVGATLAEFQGQAAILAGTAAIMGAVASATGAATAALATPMAAGGIVTQPTFALVGEAGAEAVIPLDRLNDFAGEGMTQTIVVELDGRQLAKSMFSNMPSSIRARGISV